MKKVANENILSACGIIKAFSHLETVAWLVPIASATCTTVRLFSIRNSFNRSLKIFMSNFIQYDVRIRKKVLTMYADAHYCICMEELKKAITDGKKAINRIRYDLEHYNIEVPLMPDWQEIVEVLIFLKGYIACLESMTK